ncbi:MAG: nucleotidyltransferase domain-containing protein [Candidatus Methanoperedens sp.]|nr:nucleotidyltransferase domain-containing protein [Candidatus Methanoperedens sp.]
MIILTIANQDIRRFDPEAVNTNMIIIPHMQKEYKKLIEEYCSAIKNHFTNRLISICLFGSVAREEAKPDSDIDILIVAEAFPKDIGMRIKETNEIHEFLKKSEAYIILQKSYRSGLVSDIFFTSAEIKKHPPILLDIIDDGIILYDKGSFLSNELKILKNRLESQMARKIITAKGHFWILKPDVAAGEVVEL